MYRGKLRAAIFAIGILIASIGGVAVHQGALALHSGTGTHSLTVTDGGAPTLPPPAG